jgi:hypothetical protein
MLVTQTSALKCVSGSLRRRLHLNHKVLKKIAALEKRRPFCPMHYLTPIRNF